MSYNDNCPPNCAMCMQDELTDDYEDEVDEEAVEEYNRLMEN